MTNEQINIAIAESVGAVWKRQSCSPWYPDDEALNVYFRRLSVYFRRLFFIYPNDERGPALLPDAEGTEMIADENPIPDYCNDLNAMHEVEMGLDYPALAKYRDTLTLLCINDGKCKCYWIASAKLRAEAYLRTIGKWKE